MTGRKEGGKGRGETGQRRAEIEEERRGEETASDGEELKRGWGGDESSPGYQPRWAGLLWGWQCDTYAENAHTGRRFPPSCCLNVSSCCRGGWKTIQGCH